MNGLPNFRGSLTVDGKPWFASRTIWVQVLTFVAAFLAWLVGQPLVAQYPDVASALVGGTALLNVALRLITETPIATAPKIEPPRL